MMALRLAWEGTFEYAGLALLILMYLSIIITVGRTQRQAAYDNLRLRYENLDLIEQLTQQKQVAEQASIAKSRFLASASHDLRQPLHALSLFVSTLMLRNRNKEDTELVENIRRSVNALDNLFNALLDISRLDAGIVQAKITATKIEPLVRRLGNEYALQASNKNLLLQVECEDVAVNTDPVLLETILRNLISNALRYTNTGSVTIKSYQQDNVIYVEVCDTGVGIPEEHQKTVFDEFFQLQNPERDRTKGLGLGLSIVKRLCALLQHEIKLGSVPSFGTRVLIRLGESVVSDKVEPRLVMDDSVVDVSGEGIRVLVVDDEVAVLKAMQALLSEWGYAVLIAESMQEAISATDAAPDVIISDYRLRENQTGVEVINKLRQHWKKDIPALIVTGEIGAAQLREVVESRLALLHKPVQPGRLRAFLRQAVAQSA